jgi:hypothetical protein
MPFFSSTLRQTLASGFLRIESSWYSSLGMLLLSRFLQQLSLLRRWPCVLLKLALACYCLLLTLHIKYKYRMVYNRQGLELIQAYRLCHILYRWDWWNIRQRSCYIFLGRIVPNLSCWQRYMEYILLLIVRLHISQELNTIVLEPPNSMSIPATWVRMAFTIICLDRY